VAGERKGGLRSSGSAASRGCFSIHLGAVERGIAQTTFDRIAEAIAAFEGSPEATPFSAKYDYVIAGKVEFTPDEKDSYELLRSKDTHCNECHRDAGRLRSRCSLFLLPPT
jgi:cytochrome c peroxidase